MTRRRNHALLLLALLLWVAGAAFAQVESSLTEPPPGRGLFRIGYLRRETAGHPPGDQLDSLRTHMLAQELVARELAREGFEGVGLYPCDGPNDLLQRLNASEFHLAFVPANIQAAQQAGYTAILKSRRPEDSFSVNDRVWRQGVVFITPRCPLFKEPTIDRAALADYLARERFAVVSTQSVAGYQAPLLRLAVDYEIVASEGGYLWFDSSEETVKGVFSGLADIGACDESALIRILREEGLEARRDDLVRIILRTDPVTTDPVVVLPEFAPRVSALGRELRNAIRDHAESGAFGDQRYTSATDSDYRSIVELNREFDRLVGEISR